MAPKYTNANNYTHELHMATVRLLLDHLGLTDTGSVTLVCQDWGGLTGLSVVKDMKDSGRTKQFFLPKH